MKLKYFFSTFTLLILLSISMDLSAQNKSTWKLFEDAQFADAYIEEFEAYASLLVYDDEMKALDGSEITITGYYIPVEEKVLIISRFPNASCFFCGNAGMESVMEVRTKKGGKHQYKTDQLLTYKGTLSINHTDWEYVSFILEDAILISD